MTELLHAIVTILLFVIVLGGIVLAHEAGHYVAARLAKVRVLEFGFGFPPRARVLRQAGETAVTLNWLPLGGFVKMDGEDGDVSDGRSFSAKSLPVRLGILLAGVVMNVVLAAVIFIAIAWLATPAFGVRVPDGGVQVDSPAARAGIVAGDVIESLDGRIYDAYSEGILAAIRADAGQTVTLGVRHADGTLADVSVTLRPESQIDEQHGALGIAAPKGATFEGVSLDRTGSRPLDEAIGIGGHELVRWGGLVLSGLGDLVNSLVTNPAAPPPAAGPIGIAVQISTVFFTTGWVTTLYMAGVLSINLAVVNILPLPPLDGGRMLILILKRFLGPRVSLRAEQLTYVVGFFFLLVFILWISGFDIARQLGGA